MVWAQIAIWLLVTMVLGCGLAFAGFFISPNKPTPAKLEAYECGVPQVGDTKERFSVRFYLVAIMFILFDIETVFLIPWAVLHKQLGVPGLIEIGVFFVVLGFGLAYLWKRGGLEWD